MEPKDILAGTFAILTHVGIAYGLSRMPKHVEPPKQAIEVEVVKKEPPPAPKITPPEPPKPEPEPPKPQPKPIAKVKLPPQEAPPPNAPPPKEPPKAAPPVFGINMESTTEGDSSFSVPTGNSTMGDPKGPRKGKPEPLPQVAAPAGPKYQPVSALEITDNPEVDGDLCGKAVKYPDEALELGVEGDVKLRIELDENGKVHDIRLLKGLGHGLDEAAMKAMRYRSECRFKPAKGKDGKGKPFVIGSYTFHFEIPR